MNTNLEESQDLQHINSLSVRQDYSKVKNLIKPLDLIFFKGGEIISRAIRFIQQSTLGVVNKEDVWSHVGIVVTRELFDDPRLDPNKLYVAESTLSGKLNDGIKNIDNKSFFGVQIRSLDLLVKKYSRATSQQFSHSEQDRKKKNGKDKKNGKTDIGWAALKNNPFLDNSIEGTIRQDKLKANFTMLFPIRWEGIRYDFNLISLATAVFPQIKPLRWLLSKINFVDTDDWLFCSEFVFDVLQVFKFYDKRIDSSMVLPNDLLGYDTSTPSIPVIYHDVISIFK